MYCILEEFLVIYENFNNILLSKKIIQNHFYSIYTVVIHIYGFSIETYLNWT